MKKKEKSASNARRRSPPSLRLRFPIPHNKSEILKKRVKVPSLPPLFSLLYKTMARSIFIGGNWKSNGTRESVTELVKTLNGGTTPDGVDVVVAPTALHTSFVIDNLRKDIGVCAQNVAYTGKEKGAFTGEHTAAILKDFGLGHALVGHSERRQGQSSVRHPGSGWVCRPGRRRTEY